MRAVLLLRRHGGAECPVSRSALTAIAALFGGKARGLHMPDLRIACPP